MTTTTLILTDFARGGVCLEITKNLAADAYRALYEALVDMNEDGDCSVLIADGFVDDGGGFNRMLDMERDAAAFWSRLCEIMMNDNQQLEVVAG